MICTTETVSPGQKSRGTQVRSIRHLDSPAGRLEEILNEGAPDAPYAPAICHCHSEDGDNLNNKVRPNFDHALQAHGSLPRLFLSGDRDAFAPAAELNQMAATTAEPKKLVLPPGADHFFAGQLKAMQNTLAGWLPEQFHDARE